jgi:predicted nucleic acid-binding protein
MQPALFDTSLYITALRRGSEAALAVRRLAADAPLWLSAVVLEELYAGAGERERRAVERLQRDFDGVKRILVPQSQRLDSNWTCARPGWQSSTGVDKSGRGGSPTMR